MFVTSSVSSAKRKYVGVWRTNGRLGRLCFLTALRLMILLMSFYHLKSCFSNQLIKINEFFLSLELWFETFVYHLSQSWPFVILRKRYRFKFLADNKTSLLPKIKMKGIEIVKGQQPLQWHKDWSLLLSWEGVWSRSISLLKVSVIGSLCEILDLQQVLSQRNFGMNKILASSDPKEVKCCSLTSVPQNQ